MITVSCRPCMSELLLCSVSCLSSQGCSTLAFTEEEKAEVALSPKEWKSFKLAKKVTVAKNEDTGISTVWLRFSLDSPEQQLGLPVASCFVTRWDHE